MVEGYTLQIPVNSNQFDMLARLIDALVKKGARPGTMERGLGEGYYGSSSLRLIDFVVTDLDRLVRQATADAVARARQMAEQLAQQMGRKQFSLQIVRVDSVSYQQPGAFGGVPVEPTRERLSFPAWRPVQVTVTSPLNSESPAQREGSEQATRLRKTSPARRRGANLLVSRTTSGRLGRSLALQCRRKTTPQPTQYVGRHERASAQVLFPWHVADASGALGVAGEGLPLGRSEWIPFTPATTQDRYWGRCV